MNYKIDSNSSVIQLNVEATFTLIDFTALIVCFILGFIFAVFFWIFFIAVFIKVFASHEFIFNTDSYSVTQNIRWFSYLKIKRREFSFGEVKCIRFSNEESGNALQETMKIKEWFTIDIILKSNFSRIVKVPEDELPDADELYLVLKERMGEFFKFETDIVYIDKPEPESFSD
ncbi:MAG: hypothetical protein JJ892_03730 [Balneola sp.]|nr:hypothetical protein [Balneola sp.]MBO6650767.1 hypothetical protein [Balneola sp.]MBO6710680.1 hypothetical protein [Balneola sp.]MBO6799366.1 hypothetical protein [Balneola sp.]MBO6869505.1 hypothetical protein [Balneola sp.]